jgi:hypothetical protein
VRDFAGDTGSLGRALLVARCQARGGDCASGLATAVSEAEYIAVLWRIVIAEAVIIGGLVSWSVGHLLTDRETRVDVQRCKDALGINGRGRHK